MATELEQYLYDHQWDFRVSYEDEGCYECERTTPGRGHEPGCPLAALLERGGFEVTYFEETPEEVQRREERQARWEAYAARKRAEGRHPNRAHFEMDQFLLESRDYFGRMTEAMMKVASAESKAIDPPAQTDAGPPSFWQQVRFTRLDGDVDLD